MSALPGARPITLRRNTGWYASSCATLSSGKWLACSTLSMSRLTFWPLPETPASVVDGYREGYRPVAFSPDSRWLATSWGDKVLRLWPLPGSGTQEVRLLDGPRPMWRDLVFDPGGRFLFAVGSGGNAWIFPLDGRPARSLEGFTGELESAAVSPSGRLVATAEMFMGEKALRVWDLEADSVRVFPLPEPPPPPEGFDSEISGYVGGVHSLQFDGESILYTSGHGGIRRWDLETGAMDLLWEPPRSVLLLRKQRLDEERRHAYVITVSKEGESGEGVNRIERVDLRTGRCAPVPGFPDGVWFFDLTRNVLVANALEGSVRVGRIGGGPAHVLAGHVGVPSGHVAVSPDLKWVASTGEDNTLRLWPMPDLSKPPLHTLPHDELIAKLKSLTNLRAVRDPEAEGGWKIELAPFPGWKDVPMW